MNCLQCGKFDLCLVGVGIECVEECLWIFFLNYLVLCIDCDSILCKYVMCDFFVIINSGELCILVGIQMFVKGYYFLWVILVVIFDVDGGLFFVDFCVSECMVQQIVQVVGCVGCVEEFGWVLIQIYLVDYLLLVQFIEDGYFVFVEQVFSECCVVGLLFFVYFVLLCVEVYKLGQVEVFFDSVCSVVE